MKKILVLILSLLFIGMAAAYAREDAVVVVTTFYPLYVATINVAEGVPGVAVFNLTPPEAGCPHEYQLTAKDRALLARADILVTNGAGLESFLDHVLPMLPASTVETSAGIALLPGRHEESNPHVWISVAGMKAQVKNIIDGLSAADPQNAQDYLKNGSEYIEKLTQLEREMTESLSPVAGRPIITFHEAFDYFARDYGLRVVAVMESDTGGAPAAREIADIVETAKKERVQALFTEPFNQNVTVDIIAREANLPIYVLDPVVSGTPGKDADAYINAMKENTKILLEALR